jgi:hypothetical protein
MTKQDLYSLTGGPSAAARIFGITPSAVSQWPDPIPEARVFELKGRRPDLFEQLSPLSASEAPAPA